MPFVQALYQGLGWGFSFTGLALVVPICFLFKQHFGFLDHIQLTYLYFMVLAPTSGAFSEWLRFSWSEFIPNFLKFCSNNDLVCTEGFALSFSICLVGVLFLLFIIVNIQKCRKPDVRYEPVYSFLKGLFRWTYLPLSYYSLSYLITLIYMNNTANSDFIPAIIITAWTVLFPIIQLIVYKVIQQDGENIWIKWIQFFSYMRQFTIALVLVFYQVYGSPIAKYFVYGPLVLFTIVYAWKARFRYRVLQRVLYVLEEAIAITIFSLFLFDVTSLTNYDIDFIGLAVILLLSIIFHLVKIVNLVKYGKQSMDEKINPEEERDQNKNRQIQIVETLGKKQKNKYEDSNSGQQLQNSRDSLMNSVRKGNQRRKR